MCTWRPKKTNSREHLASEAGLVSVLAVHKFPVFVGASGPVARLRGCAVRPLASSLSLH